MLPTFNTTPNLLHTRKQRGDLEGGIGNNKSNHFQQNNNNKTSSSSFNKQSSNRKIVFIIILILVLLFIILYYLFIKQVNDNSNTTTTIITNEQITTTTTTNDVSSTTTTTATVDQHLPKEEPKQYTTNDNQQEEQHEQPTITEEELKHEQELKKQEEELKKEEELQKQEELKKHEEEELKKHEEEELKKQREEEQAKIPPPLVKRVKTQSELEQDLIFIEIAKLLTNPDQTSEGSYGWYRKQLDSNNRLGNTLFDDSIMTKLGFQSTVTTSEVLFHYFRTFNTTSECSKQHSCKLYADKRADEFIDKGQQLDAVLLHCFYREPFFLNSKHEQVKHLKIFHSLINNNLNLNLINNNLINNNLNLNIHSMILKHSNEIDYLYGEKMWRGMRRLIILMCSEALIVNEIKNLIQTSDDYQSMERFASEPVDISICFLSTCSIWVNYQYWQLSLSKSNEFGKKTFNTTNKGICAFISNCDRGGYELKERYELLVELSKYIPIKQYGKCGKNTQEGPFGKSYEIENNCRFYYAAENSRIKDYVTEKFFEGIKSLQNGAKTLMLYRGAPNLRKDWNFPKSLYIDIDDFKSIEELGEYLKLLNENDDEFEKRFSKITMKERRKIDKAIDGFEYRLGTNIPCRICSIIGDMKLARYLLFKIGLKPNRPRIHLHEWEQFKLDMFSDKLSPERLEILDHLYHMAYNIFQYQDNKKNKYNLGWKFEDE